MSVAVKYGIVVLAAGESSRLGRPKQLLEFGHETLLTRVVKTAKEAINGPVIVVLGSNAESLKRVITNENVHIVVNNEWEEGMSSSLRTGVQFATSNFPALEGLILSVCDQPFVSAKLLQQLIDVHEQNGSPIVASEYDNTVGTPAFFEKALFSELLELVGDRGAKQLMNKHQENLGTVNFPLGSKDIDTEEDYQRLLAQNKDE